MLLGTKGLKNQSINLALMTMIRRAVLAGPLHVFAFLFLIADFDDVSASYAWICFTVILVAALMRYAQYKFCGTWLTREGWRGRWRLFFQTHTLMLGLAWGATCGMTVLQLGIGRASVAVFAVSHCIAAASVPAFSFDLLTQFVFQALMIFPITAAIWIVGGPGAHAMAFAFLLFWVFMCYAGISVFRFQVGLLTANELAEDQKEKLDVSHQSEKKARELIETMLESIDEAFLYFDSDGVCADLLSRRSAEVTGLECAHKNIGELFSEDESELKGILDWYRLLFSDRLDFKQIAEMGPKTLTRRSDQHIIRLKYHAVRSADGTLQAVVVTGLDVTREVKAEKRAALEREKADVILRVQENRTGFKLLLLQLEAMVETMIAWSPEQTSDLRREIHTVKGGLMMFGVRTFAEKVYQAELSIRDGDIHAISEKIIYSGALLRNDYYSWRNSTIHEFTQLGLYGNESVEISNRKLRQLQQRLSVNEQASLVCEAMVKGIVANDFGDILEDFQFHIDSTAQKLGKKINYRVKRPLEEIWVNETNREALRTFVHVINNSIDHGIENPEARLALGKPSVGTVQVSYEHIMDKNAPWIRVIIEDDGRGIDIAKLREKRKSQGIDERTDLQIAMLIFEDGVSTKETLSSISGQGIGMGAVRAAVLKARGKIRIARTDSQGTLFEILLPNSEEVAEWPNSSVA